MSEKLFFTFKDIVEDTKMLAKNILNSSTRYDAIIAISGGGLVPARLLRNYLKVPIYCVNIKTYDEKNEQTGDVKIYQWLGKHEMDKLAGKNVLFIDDLDDTRNTLRYIVRLSRGLKCSKIGFGLLYNKKKEKKYQLPDEYEYFTASDIEDKWVVFPWE